jgi:hypothetical protein
MKIGRIDVGDDRILEEGGPTSFHDADRQCTSAVAHASRDIDPE